MILAQLSDNKFKKIKYSKKVLLLFILIEIKIADKGLFVPEEITRTIEPRNFSGEII
jgi:hypothetical protein